MAGHAVSDKLLHLGDDSAAEPAWGEVEGEYTYGDDEEEEEEVHVPACPALDRRQLSLEL